MNDKQQELPPEDDDRINVFDQIDALTEDETRAIVEVMLLDSSDRVEALMALENPEDVGMYYAVYGRYVATQAPYTPNNDALTDMIGLKISIMEKALDDKLEHGYIWNFDSGLLADITQLTLRTKIKDDMMDEALDGAPIEKEYPH